MKNTKIKTVFYILIALFILLLSYFLIPVPEKQSLFPLVAVLGLLFLVLGITLVIFALKTKGKLKFFLILTGISAVAPFVFSILHNVFYAFAVLSENMIVLKYIFDFLEAASFIIALMIAPLAFLAGVIGSMILLRKK
ncbi:hypothetical protein KY345_00640 [Candidatus Woesearchaeota archaeon]|nr:hypothetical protein [Candidatus Woesearchaeota archaeon]